MVMLDPLDQLAQAARALQKRPTLEQVLQIVVDTAAEILGTQRASLRLLDPSREKLIATCRAGRPLHEDPNTSFRLGEGLIGWIAAHAEPLRLADAESDARFAPRPGMRHRLRSFVGVPLVAGELCMGVLTAVSDDERTFEQRHERLLVLLAAIAAPHVEMARLARLSRVDRLTGALNRRGLDDTFPEVVAEQEGVISPLTVAMADLDHFKRINDELGHAFGDEVLKEVARRLSGSLRGGDAVIRYGGEEFVLLLPSVDLAAGARIAERARKSISGRMFTIFDTSVSLTISIGVAERRDGEGRGALIARADEAMYRAKRAGRNRIEVADSTPAE